LSFNVRRDKGDDASAELVEWCYSTQIVLFISGCATQAPLVPTSAEQTQQTIPADSPLAKIHEGMSKAEMLSLLGPPTDQGTSVTGKAFIPFYFDGDATAARLHYNGLGWVYVLGQGTFGGGEKVFKIEYDPQESGLWK
jgi:hypothetical protein